MPIVLPRPHTPLGPFAWIEKLGTAGSRKYFVRRIIVPSSFLAFSIISSGWALSYKFNYGLVVAPSTSIKLLDDAPPREPAAGP